MSDSDEFGDFDSFDVDDSFFRAVDDIEARAATRAGGSKRLGGPADGDRRPTVPVQQNAEAGPSKRAEALGVRLSRPPAPPSSDDFDDLSISAETLAQIDSVAAAPPPRLGLRSTLPPSNGTRQIGRTGSGSRLSLQTHLHFRREAPTYTKGKRWDRTAFAASGRRLGAEKVKGKGKGRAPVHDDDEDENEEFDLLAPPPKLLVDTSKPYERQRHEFNSETIRTYIYPTNHPKRDYQFDIIRACLTDNCLVALPTGLGKTFVAGVVMLNYYRWFPSGKIVFLAPTKPLVNQQIEACQVICGIPSADAAVMTGAEASAKQRDRLWEERRVFYCTPQTLDNDLKRGAVDPRDIVLAVFDEAHKASGSYAYTTILAYITAHHPYFRVLALTATPGSDVPKVQGVVDALHISRIEIREAEAPEIQRYMNKKIIEKHVVKMGPIIEELRDRWAALMKPYIQKLVDKNILTERDLDAKRLRPFSITARRMDIARDRTSGAKWAIGSLTQIEKMARAMGHLLEFSLGMFHTALMEIAGNATKEGKKGNSRPGANSIRNNVEFQRLLGDVESELSDIRRHRNGKSHADRHPKMQKTLELALAHFAQAEEDETVHETKNDTRAMVFCSFRECVLEVVDMLNEHPGLLRATKFVGQAQGKQEKDKGFNQKEQKKTIQEFKEGRYNILVSTSIGEEGLDIGEVDFVVIYDMPKQSIKLLQRIGRTGRKRAGNVHVLMSEFREDLNWDTAQQTHRDIQEEILHSRNLELFEDVERLLPPGPLPECVERFMEVDPWDPSDQKRTRKLAAAKDFPTKPVVAKRKRVSEIPDDAPSGFTSVAKLLKQQGKRGKKKRSAVSNDEEDGDEDTLDEGRQTKKTSSVKSQEQMEVEEEDEKRESLRRGALDFFNTQGTIRRRSPMLSPTGSPVRSSPPAGASKVSDGMVLSSPEARSVGGIKLTPRTAAAAGFSQVADLVMDDGLLSPSPKMASVRQSISDMPPPPVPFTPGIQTPQQDRQSAHTPLSSTTEPTPFPIRRRATRPIALPSSDPADSPGLRPLQRLRRRHMPSSPALSSPMQRPRRRRADPAVVAELMDVDVSVSGSESSDESSGTEDESDRLFAGEFAATQAPKGYNQTAMYAAGLSTQAASRTGLAFAGRDKTETFLAKARKPVALSQEAHEPNSEDEYELGSFVCDDEDVSFDSQSDLLGSRPY